MRVLCAACELLSVGISNCSSALIEESRLCPDADVKAFEWGFVLTMFSLGSLSNRCLLMSELFAPLS